MAETTTRTDQIAPPANSLLGESWAWPVDRVAVHVIQLDDSGNGNWRSRPNPMAGLRESRWLNEHREEVASTEEPWVAILDDEVKARGLSFAAVYAQLKDQGIRDALVVYVRPRSGPRPYRIA